MLIILWVLLFMIKIRDETTSDPAHHLFTLTKPHHTDAQCEKLNGKSFLQSYKKGWQGVWTSYSSDTFNITFP